MNKTQTLFLMCFDFPVISAGAEAGSPTIQTQHLRGIRTGQLRRPVHQWAHPAHARWRVTYLLPFCLILQFLFSAQLFTWSDYFICIILGTPWGRSTSLSSRASSTSTLCWCLQRSACERCNICPRKHQTLTIKPMFTWRLPAAWLQDNPATLTFCLRAAQTLLFCQNQSLTLPFITICP